MKSQLTWQEIQNLENSYRQPTPTKPTRKNSWSSKWNSLLQTIVARLAVADEPHVWQSSNQQGYPLWSAYDPKTGRSVKDMTAAEMQVWLEKRYSQAF